ncbi:MAG: CoA-binding protein [Candidatus Zixiibacteriota bacterium]|nr:MAG: CoA-binding protein [candidate division Zixibacteria bacterium]
MGSEGPGAIRAKEIQKLLRESKTITVAKLSSNPERAGYRVASYLKERGYAIIPVNPREKEILGEKAYPDLKSIPVPVDIVDFFRKPEATAAIAEESAAVGATAVWLQESAVSHAAFGRGEETGLFMVMDRCLFRGHRRLMYQ